MTALEMTVKPPIKIMEIMQGAWTMQAFKAAVHLDVFSKLKEPKAPVELAKELSASELGVELLLNALLSLELLDKHDGKFQLNKQVEPYLDKDSQLYMGEYLKLDKLKEAWMQLPEIVKSGKPAAMVNECKTAEEFFPMLAAAIFPLNYSVANLLATELKTAQLPAGAKVLDIAAGSGVWSLPMATGNKDLSVEALDFPAVLEVTKRFASQNGVESQYAYISGNWSECKLEADKYDLVLLGHILHSEGKERSEALLKECYRVLKKGGKIVIAEMISNNERSAPTFSQLFAINMFLLTENGCVFTEAELEKMLSACGFKDVVRPKQAYWGPESPIMYATK